MRAEIVAIDLYFSLFFSLYFLLVSIFFFSFFWGVKSWSLYISVPHSSSYFPTCLTNENKEQRETGVGTHCFEVEGTVFFNSVQRRPSREFMSSLQLWGLPVSLLLTHCSALCFMLLCSVRQSLNLVNPAISMRLRLKRFVGFCYFSRIS